MANVKITDLTELAAADLATNDVLPIVDINNDSTKKVTIASLTGLSDANDFITFTRLNANLDIVQDNVAAISVTLGIRGDGGTNDDVTVGTEELVFLGDTGITTTVSSNTVTIDLDDTAVTAGLYGGVSGGVTNVAAVTIDATGRITNAANISVVTNLDTLQDNINVLDGNADAIATDVTALEARRVANIAGAISTVLTSDLTASRALASDGSGKVGVATTTLAELNHVSGVTAAIQTQIDAVESRRAANNITTTFTDDVIVTGNLTINGDTTTINTTNMDVDDTLIMLANGTTGSPANDIGILFNRGAQGNAAFFYDESAKTFKLSDTKDPKSNTSLSPVTASNLSVGIVDAATLKYDGLSVHTSIADNASVASAASTAVEARRVANIAGAISTVLTGDLTADRVMITNGSGKIAASSGVTPTELGYLDGLTLGTVAASKAVTADSNGDVNFIREVDIDGNVVIGTNASNTVTIVGVLDCGAFS